jgi:2-polyprenyl-6-hydroxyphenyl methylase/3-demethylubiquinone-9 3-methyltransferase
VKHVEFDSAWPETWQSSYRYDLLEIYGDTSIPGYSYAYANRTQTAMGMVHSVCPPPATVLDVAAGQGNLTLKLAEAGYVVTWNDLREDLVKYVQRKHERGEVHFEPGNMLDLDASVGFDVVVLAEIVEHVAHPDELLRAAHHLVRPGGHVVVTTPNGRYFRTPLPKFSDCADPSRFESSQFQPDGDGHIFLLHPEEMKSLAEASGFRVQELRLFINPLTRGHLGTSGLLKWLPESMVWTGERLGQRLPMRLRSKMHVHLASVLTPR